MVCIIVVLSLMNRFNCFPIYLIKLFQAAERKRRMLRMVDPGTTLVKEIKKHPAAFGTHPIQFVKDFKYLKREQDARYAYLISF